MIALRTPWIRRALLALLAVALVSLAVGAAVRDGSGDDTGALQDGPAAGLTRAGGGEGGGGSVGAPADKFAYDEEAARDGVFTTQSASGPPAIDDRIIKSADLGVRVEAGAFEQAWKRAFSIASQLGGHVLSSDRGRETGFAKDDDAAAFGTLVIRVPSARFEEATNKLRELGEVTGDSVSSRDVTEEFVDLESRLRHFRAQETVLLRLLDRAESVSDVIAVQNTLSEIQLQIEQIQGRLQFLKNQTDLSTITLQLAEPDAAPGGPGHPWYRDAWGTALDGLQWMGSAALVAVVWAAPFVLMAALWMAYRRRGRPVPQT